MQTVVLAGGIGKRIYPLSSTRPKPMFKILGKPLLEHTLNTLIDAGLKDFIIVTGPHADQIRNYFEDGSKFGINIRYTSQENALGMANAIQTAKNLINDDFLVVNGDDVFDSSLIEDKLESFKTNGTELLLSCKPVEETWKYGILKLNGDRVENIVEKPPKGQEPSNLGIIGAYILPTKIFDYYEKVPVNDAQHELAIQKFIDDGHVVNAKSYDGVFTSFKYPWDLLTINQHLMNKLITKTIIEENVKISEKSQIEGNVWISKGAIILENAVVKGPVYVGANALLGTNVLIRNFSSIGDRSVIGFSSEINNSVIGDDCWFHTNYVGDSIIGDNCSFGSRAVVANFRFDADTIKVNISDNKIDSGRDKLGVIMADDSKVGVNATITPGMKVGPNSIIGPNVCLTSDLEQDKIILVDRQSYIIKENKLDASSDKKNNLTSRLKTSIGYRNDRRV